ncbi:hypothetical protein ACIB24_02300 [Spongisporangium articulatum]|uniref:Uncharacterized protein n=1 Tax=Spongisporangium articulatum TaxID=3362603 RepID=A0ABW8AHQ2_9ACTN
MAASLLLEGPDLRALLEQAHQQGGPQARIVRAEKVRHGGVFGFFAREVFEVAVEIPGPDEDTTEQPDAVAPAAGATSAGAGETPARETGAPQPVPDPPAAGPVKAEMTPIPTGLMDLAARVEAQERAAAGEAVAHAAQTEAQLHDVPLAVGGVIGHELSAPMIRIEGEFDDVDEPDGRHDEPEPVRPQFTALIDQLRTGVRDGRHREDGYRHTTDHPVVAALHAGLNDDPEDLDGVPHGLGSQHTVSALEAEAWAHVMTENDPASETDGSTMSEPTATGDVEALYADLDPHPFAATSHRLDSDDDHGLGLPPLPDFHDGHDLLDEHGASHALDALDAEDGDGPVEHPEPLPAAPSNRAASILPKAAKPAKATKAPKSGRRRGFTPLRGQVDEIDLHLDGGHDHGADAPVAPATAEATRAMVEEAVAGRAAERSAARAEKGARLSAEATRPVPGGSRRSDAPLTRNPEPQADQPATTMPTTMPTTMATPPATPEMHTESHPDHESRGEILPSTPTDRRASWWRLGRKRRTPVEPMHWMHPEGEPGTGDASTAGPETAVSSTSSAPAGGSTGGYPAIDEPVDEETSASAFGPASAFDAQSAFGSSSASAFAHSAAMPTPMPRPSFPAAMPTTDAPVVPAAPPVATPAPAPVAMPTPPAATPPAAPAPAASPPVAMPPVAMPPVAMPTPADEPEDFAPVWHEPAPVDDAPEPPTSEDTEPAVEPFWHDEGPLAADAEPAPAVPAAMPEQRTGGFTAAVTDGPVGSATAGVIENVDELADDRQALRDLGLPAAWTRRLVAGDRFTSVLGILDRLPELEIDGDDPVIVVVGPSDVVELEAHRTALDLPVDGRPRAVVALPGTTGEAVREAVAAANATRPVVVAIPLEFGADATEVRALIHDLRTHSVIAVVDATQPLEAMTRWFDSLERVDAVALDRALESSRPAAVLGLDVPVVRLDGIAMDRIGWAALLCAQLAARDLEQLADAR